MGVSAFDFERIEWGLSGSEIEGKTKRLHFFTPVSCSKVSCPPQRSSHTHTQLQAGRALIPEVEQAATSMSARTHDWRRGRESEHLRGCNGGAESVIGERRSGCEASTG